MFTEHLFSLTPSQIALLLAGVLVLLYAIMVTMMLYQRRKFEGDASAQDQVYRRFMHGLKEGVMITDETGRFIDANGSLGTLTGYSRAELSRISLPDLFPGDAPKNKATYKLFHQLLRKRRHHFEPGEEIRRKDGRVTAHDTHYLYLGNDTVLSVVQEGVKGTPPASREKYSEQYIRQIMDLSLDMIVAVDKQRRIIEFNRAAEKAFGYHRDDVEGKHVSMLYADENQGRKAHGATFAEVDYQYILNKRKNGDIFPSLLASRVLYGEDGDIIGLVGYSREVRTETLEKQAHETKDVSVVHTINARPVEYFFRSTLRGVFLEVTPALVRSLGYDAGKDLIAMSETDTLYVDPNDRKKFHIEIDSPDTPARFTVVWRKIDGEPLQFNIAAHLVKDADGSAGHIEGVARPDSSTIQGTTLYLHQHNPAS